MIVGYRTLMRVMLQADEMGENFSSELSAFYFPDLKKKIQHIKKTWEENEGLFFFCVFNTHIPGKSSRKVTVSVSSGVSSSECVTDQFDLG